MVDRAMTTSRAVTHKKEPRFRIPQSWAVESDPQLRGLSLRNDAAIAAFALNTSRGNGAYDRLASLHRDLRKLRAETAELARVRRIKEINRRLRQYVFHPCVALMAGYEGRFGIVALAADSFIPASADQLAITEADAALSLARLNAMGDLEKVRLCEVCRERWLAATKSNYRFCSKECREKFYESQPDYHQRKAKNQRKYRVNLQLKQAAEDAVLSKRRKK